jgi:hypothetical protein
MTITLTREEAQQVLDTLNKAISFKESDTLWSLEFLQSVMRLGNNLRARLAQPEPEPVAWIHRFIEHGISIGKKPVDLDKHPDRWMPVYKDPTPCQTCEALARTVMMDQTSHDIQRQRNWQGLTDETLDDIYFCVEGGASALETWRQQARAIEAKLKEKNNG